MTVKNDNLASLMDWREEIALVPFSGVQILDFGFSLEDATFKACKFIERTSSEAGQQVERVLLPLTGDSDLDEEVESAALEDDDPYSVKPLAALDPFLGEWIPVPVLRLKNERGPSGEKKFDPGPSNWARMRTVKLDRQDPITGHTHRVQLALDTSLISSDQRVQYVAPEMADAEKGRDFCFVSDPVHMDWFLRRLEKDPDNQVLDLQLWVSEWLETLFMSFKQAERPGRRITKDKLPHLFEHWARYLTYLQLLQSVVRIPRMRFVNTISKRDAVTPVEVDLVLDIGNSRTCGILIERFPGEGRVDLARSFPLEVRDLGRPEHFYTGLIDSRVEFSELRFGDDRFASRSGRRSSFNWPSFIRVGPEALRLVASEEGTETTSGLSSPKRYLWDSDPRQQDWRFHNHDDPNNLPKSLRAAMRFLNESGDVLEQVTYEESRRLRARGKTNKNQAIRPRFSKSSLFSFMLAEIITHALVQVNAPASRARRAQSDLPRRLNRIILTLPTATSMQEQSIMRSRAEGALRLVWNLLGVREDDSSISRRPELIVEWDEASCTQLVYLYSELTQKYEGRIDSFLQLKGKPRPETPGAQPENSIRLACIDIGGGTTDLMITTYWGEANRVLHPQQTFREGFRVAGDELVQRVISAIVFPKIQEAIEAAGGIHVNGKLRELFGGDIGGQDQKNVQRRRQFAVRVLMPLAIAILEACEQASELDVLELSAGKILELPERVDMDPSEFSDAVGAIPAVPDELISYIEDAALDLGADGFRLADVNLDCARSEVDAVTREVFQNVLGNMAELVDHLGVDIVLLTGRPSRLPAVRSIFEEMLAVTPDRLVSMYKYRTGRWYPFRDPVTQRIGDPKSTVAVGGMLIALCESRIPNFKVATDALHMQSTARFVGEMDISGQIKDERIIFSNLDLDKGKSDGDQTATVQMYAPMYFGARQLALERWTTTPLFRLDYNNASAQRRPSPLRITFEKADFDDDEAQTSEAILRQEALREAFVISEIEDGDGDGMKTTDVVLRLHTLGFEDEYWIDTGLFRI